MPTRPRWWLALWIVVGAPLAARELDRFDYTSSEQAASVWQASEGTPPVQIVRQAERGLLEFQIPLGRQRRAVIDRDVAWDLRADAGFELELAIDRPDIARNVTLYFHSREGGWWAQSHVVADRRWQRLSFPKTDFRQEDRPSGWGAIDRVRIAVWRSSETEEAVCIRLRRLAAVQHAVAVVVDPSDTDDGKLCRQVAQRIEDMLGQAGLPVDRIDQTTLDAAHVGQRRLLIFPYNPRLGDESVEFLRNGVERSRFKIVLCYQLPGKLQTAIGMKRGTYFRPDRKGGLAQIVPVSRAPPGFPDKVQQRSWNVATAIPTGHDSRVVAWWHDDQGNRTKHAAWVVGSRAAYFSHIILDDDRQAKRQMLLAILGTLDPTTWRTVALTRRQQAEQIGHLLSRQEWQKWLGRSGSSEAHRAIQSARNLEQQIDEAIQREEYFQAAQLVHRLDQLRRQAYRQAMPPVQLAARGWWNHSGLGAYPGDWERTARELRQRGFNMVLPNMLWGGVAHYASDVLPRSRDFQQYGDQIRQCVEAAHRHGIEVHVWKVNFNLGHQAPKEFVERLRREGRLQVSADGEPTDWLNPAHPENVRLEVESMLEVVRKYDVDGIHFDYIRYPNRHHDYSDYSRQAFEKSRGKKVVNWPADCYSGTLKEEYAQWRRDQITHVVAEVSRRARELKPDIKISAAVFSGYPDCRNTVAQDWPLWARRGYVDFLCPMNYTDDDRTLISLISRQRKVLPDGFPLYTGIGATASRSRLDTERVLGQIFLASQNGAQGFVIFNLSEDTLGRIALPTR